MADEHLAKAGLFVDDLNQLRLVNPEVAETLQGAQEKSQEFYDQLKNFLGVTGGLIESIEELAKVVETEKIKAMMVRNTTEREANGDDPVILQMTVRELTVEKERLKTELEAVKKIEREQEDIIHSITEK